MPDTFNVEKRGLSLKLTHLNHTIYGKTTDIQDKTERIQGYSCKDRSQKAIWLDRNHCIG